MMGLGWVSDLGSEENWQSESCFRLEPWKEFFFFSFNLKMKPWPEKNYFRLEPWTEKIFCFNLKMEPYLEQKSFQIGALDRKGFLFYFLQISLTLFGSFDRARAVSDWTPRQKRFFSFNLKMKPWPEKKSFQIGALDRKKDVLVSIWKWSPGQNFFLQIGALDRKDFLVSIWKWSPGQKRFLSFIWKWSPGQNFFLLQIGALDRKDFLVSIRKWSPSQKK